MNTFTLPRRSFLKAAALAGGGFALGYVPPASAQDGAALVFNPFIRIGADGIVTLVVHKPENGQGSVTTMCMLLAEELECDWDTLH